MTKQYRALVDRYRSARSLKTGCLTALLGLLLLSGVASAQTFTNINTRYKWVGGLFDSDFGVPIRDTTFTPYRVGMQVFRAADSLLYTSIALTGKKWAAIGGGNFILNQTAQQTANYNISGYGISGGLLVKNYSYPANHSGGLELGYTLGDAYVTGIDRTSGGAVYKTIYYNGSGHYFSVPSGGSLAAVFQIGNNGILTAQNLAGSGTRMVVADGTGVLSTQAIPTGATYTAGYGLSLASNQFKVDTSKIATRYDVDSSIAAIPVPNLQSVTDAGTVTSNEIEVQGVRIGGVTANLNTYVGRNAFVGGSGVGVSSYGYSAANGNTGNYVTAVGQNAALNNNVSNVVAVGVDAGNGNTGARLTAVGESSASGNTGEYVVSIGQGAGSGNTYSYITLLGNNATATANNQFVEKAGDYNFRKDHAGLSADRLRTLANADGNEVLTVNGQTANASGAITIPVGTDTTSLSNRITKNTDSIAAHNTRILANTNSINGKLSATTGSVENGQELFYNSSTWVNGTRSERAKYAMEFFEDFLFPVANRFPFDILTSGTGAAITPAPNTEWGAFPGVAKLVTGTTTTGYATLWQESTQRAAPMQIGSGKILFEMLNVGFPTLADATDNYVSYLGMFPDGRSSQSAFGIYFEYVRDSSANWRIVSANNSVRSYVTTNIPVVAGQAYDLKIEINAAGTEIRGYIDGVQVTATAGSYPITTNIAPSTVSKYPGFIIRKTAGTTSRTLYLDAVGITQYLTTPR